MLHAEIKGLVKKVEMLYADTYAYSITFDNQQLPRPFWSMGLSITSQGEKLYAVGEEITVTIHIPKTSQKKQTEKDNASS